MKTFHMTRRAMLLSAGAFLFAAQTFGVAPARADQTFVIAKAADPQTLDPAQTIDNNDWTITYPIYQRLMKYEVSADGKGLTSVTGDLAKSWKASADGLTWVFDLAEGNAFSDGAPVDAKAVEYSFRRLFAMGQGPSEAFPKGITVEATGPCRSPSSCRNPLPRSSTPLPTMARASFRRPLKPRAARRATPGFRGTPTVPVPSCWKAGRRGSRLS